MEIRTMPSPIYARRSIFPQYALAALELVAGELITQVMIIV